MHTQDRGDLVRPRPFLERQATRSKSFFFLAAGLSLLMSVYLFFNGQKEQGIYVGLWVPSILSAGALLMAGGSDE